MDLIVNPDTELVTGHENTNYSHPKGYYQPGVLVLDKHGRVLYRWRGIPTRKNMGGATERPTARHVHEQVERALQVPPAEARDAQLDRAPKLDMRGIPWPLFVSILVANGWFIRPVPFPHIPGGASIKQRFLRAMLRIPMFIALWIVAFVWLPPLWVGSALVGWCAWITPGIRNLNRQFQNLPKLSG